ncbi:hypothetical protein IPL85_05885 [Candidatus Saccharibacteria bacterium]|nr:MAG: hypothetical protein IPL85_05885 [Candidatus Saccharibacteria bacterium]
MDLNNLRWYDYIILLVFFGITGIFVFQFVMGLFMVGDDKSGFMGLALILGFPVTLVSAFVIIKVAIAFLKRR